MHQSATRHDFLGLSHDQQERYTVLLRTLRAQNLSCRCEMLGKDFAVVVAPGLSSAKLWMDRFDIDERATVPAINRA